MDQVWFDLVRALVPIVLPRFLPGWVISPLVSIVTDGILAAERHVGWTGPQKLAYVSALVIAPATPERREDAVCDLISTLVDAANFLHGRIPIDPAVPHPPPPTKGVR